MAKLSLLFGVLTWTALPFIGAVFAIVLGRRVLRALPPSLTRRGKGWWTARHARAGLALGALQLTMLGIVLVFAVVALAGRLLSLLLT